MQEYVYIVKYIYHQIKYTFYFKKNKINKPSYHLLFSLYIYFITSTPSPGLLSYLFHERKTNSDAAGEESKIDAPGLYIPPEIYKDRYGNRGREEAPAYYGVARHGEAELGCRGLYIPRWPTPEKWRRVRYFLRFAFFFFFVNVRPEAPRLTLILLSMDTFFFIFSTGA